MATRFIEGLGGQFQRLEDQLASDMEEVARRMVDESAERSGRSASPSRTS